MRKHSIQPVNRKKFKITTKTNKCHQLFPDLVKRKFTADMPNQLWTSDITYIWTSEGWLYLAVILDVYNREIVGWSLEKHLRKELIIKSLNKALIERGSVKGVIFHSDKGSQYSSKTVVNMLKAYGIRQSMGDKGNCYDNAITETFFHTLKTECVYLEYYETRARCRRSIFEYIEIFYNRQRSHSTLGYLSPVEYRLTK